MQFWTLNLAAMRAAAERRDTLLARYLFAGRSIDVATRLLSLTEPPADCVRNVLSDAAKLGSDMPGGFPCPGLHLARCMESAVETAWEDSAARPINREVIAVSVASAEPLGDRVAESLGLVREVKAFSPVDLSPEEAASLIPEPVRKGAVVWNKNKPGKNVRGGRWAMALKIRPLYAGDFLLGRETQRIHACFRSGHRVQDIQQLTSVFQLDGDPVLALTTALIARYYQLDQDLEREAGQPCVRLAETYMTFTNEGRLATYSYLDLTAKLDLIVTPHRAQCFRDAGCLTKVVS